MKKERSIKEILKKIYRLLDDKQKIELIAQNGIFSDMYYGKLK